MRRSIYSAARWLVLSAVFTLACSPVSDVTQPVAFNHKIHVAELEIACTECHVGVEESDHATIPNAEICLDCHDEAQGDSAAEAKLIELLATGEPIPWQRVTRVAEHVHFSHRRHVFAGRLLCETCHGDVHTREKPFARPQISFRGETGMERCIACHLASGNPRATVDCIVCHR